MAKFNFAQVSRYLATEFWDRVPTAPIFTHPVVLSRLSPGCEWWLTSQGDEPLCMWTVALDSAGEPHFAPFTYYVGPVWAPGATNRPASHIRSHSHAVYDVMIDRLLHHYGKIRAELQPTDLDVRPFSWWNYGREPDERFGIEARYSARLGPLDDFDDDQLLAGMRAVRRREIRRLLGQGGLSRSVCESPEVLQGAYQAVLEQQGLVVESRTLDSIEALWQLTQMGFGRALSWSSSADEPPSNFTLLLDDRTSAHLVLKLTTPEPGADTHSAFSVFDAIRATRDESLRFFDFNGANSPKRGDDKHSYGAGPVLFFQVSFG